MSAARIRAEVAEEIALAIERQPWADEGPYAEQAAAVARRHAVDGHPCEPCGETYAKPCTVHPASPT